MRGICYHPAKEMKMREPFTIALSSYASKILELQKADFGVLESPFVFPAISKEGYIHRDALSKALRRLNKGKSPIRSFNIINCDFISALATAVSLLFLQLLLHLPF